MSASNNCLSDDVLCEIFQTLDVPDLLSCTKVCTKWKCVIESFVLGRKFFQRLKKSPAAWPRAWRKLAQDETNLKAEDYKNICCSCWRYIEKVDGNWRAGSYKLKTIQKNYYFCLEGREFAVGEDFITNYYSTIEYKNGHVHIFDRESAKLKRQFRPIYRNYQIIDVNTVVYLECQRLSFHDINTGQLVKRFELNEYPSWFDACCPTAKLWTFVADFEHVLRLTLWTVDDAANVVLIKTIEAASIGHCEFQVDEQFILHQQRKSANYRIHDTVHFISTGIVHDTELERSLSVMSGLWFRYDRGLMFFIKRMRLIRILDVASGTYLRDINMGKKCRWIGAIKANSNYVIIYAESKLYVYSLQALRNPLPSDPFVFKIENCQWGRLVVVTVDETQIVCLDYFEQRINVFDFGSFDQTPTDIGRTLKQNVAVL